MRTNRTRTHNLVLIAFVVLGLTTLAVAVHADWSNLKTDGKGNGQSQPDAPGTPVDEIFSDGFESGSTSAWSKTMPDDPLPCPVPTLDLPTPAKR